MNLPLNTTNFTDQAILARAAEHGLILNDDQQFEFLRRIDTVDMQAAPGCGKTTLTALKLCILASGWQSGTSGVCVISHTNVAKDQIVDILKRDAFGRRFLNYPHFVGTIQSFVDTFLARPYLRSSGVDIRAIEDDFYLRAAMTELRKTPYAQLRSLINPPNPRNDLKSLVQTAHYVWEGNRMITYGTQNNKRIPFPFSSTAPSTLQFVALKTALTNQGIYCYADMFAFASKFIHEYSQIRSALQHRFPFLLIDEMQDTSRDQEEFLESIFGHGDCVVQRIGDVNQRIFFDAADDGPESAHFPKGGFISLPRSMRFSNTIALTASPLTFISPQSLIGNSERASLAPVLILFDHDTVASVIPVFGRLVLSEVSAEEVARYPVKAIGARVSGEANEFPKRIQCFHAPYNPDLGRPAKPASLYQAVICARAKTDLGWKGTSDRLWDACCELLIQWKFSHHSKRPAVGRLKMLLAEGDLSLYLRVRKAILQLTYVDMRIKKKWDQSASELCEALQSALGLATPPQQVIDFCAFLTEGVALDDSPVEKCEIHTVQCGDKKLNIHLATIHAAKGETHAATLVLECFHKVHDLKEVLPIIVGKHDKQRVAKTKSIGPAIRCTFVAMTRPRNLVAFAVRKDHIGLFISDFLAAGWRVIDLTIETG